MKKKNKIIKRNVLIGITGGIAAYKVCDLINLLRKNGNNVKIVMTKNAKEFITPMTLATLSGNVVYSEMFESRNQYNVEHIELAKWCNLMLVAPATANIIGKIANGIADDLLSTVALSLPKLTPLFIAPAMNINMWVNPAVKKNIAYFCSQKQKCHVIYPRKGRLACGDYDEGALARVDTILDALKKYI